MITQRPHISSITSLYVYLNIGAGFSVSVLLRHFKMQILRICSLNSVVERLPVTANLNDSSDLKESKNQGMNRLLVKCFDFFSIYKSNLF